MTDKITAEALVLRLLTTRMRLAQYSEAERLVQELKDVHASELAEKIRTTELPEIHVDMFDNGTQWSANLIDPEVP